MVAGKRAHIFTLNDNAVLSQNRTAINIEFRLLNKNHLGGVIFGCTKDTIKECLSKQLFGLPASHILYVKNISSGLPVFLFNYSDRKLHGIFESADSGDLNIDQYAWTADGSGKTIYPAQVRIFLRLHCQALHESQFKPIIIDNYYRPNHFWFELDHSQTSKLMSLLSSLAVAPSISLPQNVEKWRNLFQDIPSSHKGEESKVKEISYSDFDLSHSHESKGELQSATSNVALDFSCNNQPPEACLYQRPVPEDEKDFILMKLKELTLAREHSDSLLEQSVEDISRVNDVSMEQNDTLKRHIITEEKVETLSVTSCDCCHDITQIKKELEELKAFKEEQIQKNGHLEHKLAEAEKVIQQLKHRCLTLAGEIPSVERVEERIIEYCAEPLLDLEEVILLVGGFNGTTYLSSLDAYSPSQNKIKSLSPMNISRSYAAVAKLSGELYVFGGGDGRLWHDTVESYNPANDQWIPRPSLRKAKGSLAGAALDNKLFAFGGGNGLESFSEVEMLDLDLGRWITTQSMLQKRFALAGAELNGAIYAVGGFDGKDYLKSAERFDPREHTWSRIQSMHTNRGAPSIAIMNEKLYVMGGYDGKEMVSSVEVYDPRNEQWMSGEPMNTPRGYSAAAVLKESMYVIGGVMTHETISDTVESYKEDSCWGKTLQGSIGCRCFASAVVL